MKKYFRNFLILFSFFIFSAAVFSEDYRADIVKKVNVERSEEGLVPLKNDKILNSLAQKKAEIMAEEENLSHTAGGYSSFSDIFKENNIKYLSVGENIARNWKTTDEVMNAWMESLGHRKNILSPKFTHMGVGKAVSKKGDIYWVQLFIKYRD